MATPMARLANNMPPDAGAALIHNDYKYDNVVLAPDDWSQIISILDWEMATVGDPLMDLGTTLELAAMAPTNALLISESGLYTPDDLASMYEAGAKCFLIGESLMRQNDVEAATRNLLKDRNAVKAAE